GEPVDERLGVAVITPGRDFGAAHGRVPRRFGPLDAGGVSHFSSPLDFVDAKPTRVRGPSACIRRTGESWPVGLSGPGRPRGSTGCSRPSRCRTAGTGGRSGRTAPSA